MLLDLPIRTVNDMGELPDTLPIFLWPDVPLNLETLLIILPYSVSLAIVGLLESLMTATIIDDLTDGLSNFLDEKGMTSVSDLVGIAVPSVTDWQYLNLNHIEKAVIDQELCIQCGRCHVVCEDTSHQAITHTVKGERRFEVIDEECVGCNLCVSICPVDGCISMQQLTDGKDPRTGQPISDEKANWTTHPNNPMRKD